jgi:hypothetical protein
MDGDDPSGGDYQQGRPSGCSLTPDYVAGFVDGEGCFSVSVHPHPTVQYGTRWLIAPSFHVYQHRDNVEILECIREFFGCARSRRRDPRSAVMTYSVYRREDLESAIIPIFERCPLRSRKQEDFLKFREIVGLMQARAHRTDEGFRWIIETAFSMNENGQRRYKLEEVLGGTLRDCTPSASAGGGDETVRSPWRHGEGGRNDRPASRRSAGWR